MLRSSFVSLRLSLRPSSSSVSLPSFRSPGREDDDDVDGRDAAPSSSVSESLSSEPASSMSVAMAFNAASSDVQRRGIPAAGCRTLGATSVSRVA